MNKGILILALIAVACSFHIFPEGVKNCPQPTVVNYVNITQYLGAWYEQSKIPFLFELGCSHTVANYSLNPSGLNLLVNNSCIRNGKETYSVGQATPQNAGNSKLKVQFSETFDIGAQYWIVMLDANYTYAVVSSPDYAYLWILYRQPTMPPPLYNQIIAQLQQLGCYQVGKLQMTAQ